MKGPVSELCFDVFWNMFRGSVSPKSNQPYLKLTTPKKKSYVCDDKGESLDSPALQASGANFLKKSTCVCRLAEIQAAPGQESERTYTTALDLPYMQHPCL